MGGMIAQEMALTPAATGAVARLDPVHHGRAPRRYAEAEGVERPDTEGASAARRLRRVLRARVPDDRLAGLPGGRRSPPRAGGRDLRTLPSRRRHSAPARGDPALAANLRRCASRRSDRRRPRQRRSARAVPRRRGDRAAIPRRARSLYPAWGTTCPRELCRGSRTRWWRTRSAAEPRRGRSLGDGVQAAAAGERTASPASSSPSDEPLVLGRTRRASASRTCRPAVRGGSRVLSRPPWPPAPSPTPSGRVARSRSTRCSAPRRSRRAPRRCATRRPPLAGPCRRARGAAGVHAVAAGAVLTGHLPHLGVHPELAEGPAISLAVERSARGFRRAARVGHGVGELHAPGGTPPRGHPPAGRRLEARSRAARTASA